jgi:hypothetical protein
VTISRYSCGVYNSYVNVDVVDINYASTLSMSPLLTHFKDQIDIFICYVYPDAVLVLESEQGKGTGNGAGGIAPERVSSGPLGISISCQRLSQKQPTKVAA